MPNRTTRGDDAVNYAVYKLLSQLDFSPIGGDGVVDVSIDPNDVEIAPIATADVRSMWGPVEVKLITWI